MRTLKIKHLKTVNCRYCKGRGTLYPYPAPYQFHGEECSFCEGAGIEEIEREWCSECGEELEWNDWEFGFDEKLLLIYRCLENKCDLPTQ